MKVTPAHDPNDFEAGRRHNLPKVKVIDELGYFPNTQARALVSGRSRIFGLIVSEITNPFFPEIVQTFENLAVENNYEILLTSTVHDPKRMELSVRRMIERRVDGVAILTFGMEEYLLEHLRFRKVPLVFVDVGPDTAGIANIRIDYQNGIRQAVQHLAALRHTRIAFITGPRQLKSAVARRAAFVHAMTEIGLGALGVMREAYDLNIRITTDLSLIGFDDIRLAQFTTPPLTTVQMSQTELAKLAFQALMNEMEEGSHSGHAKEYKLITNLVLRQSTGLAPSAERRKTLKAR